MLPVAAKPNLAFGMGRNQLRLKRLYAANPGAAPMYLTIDHDDFGSIRSEIINVIGSFKLERDAGGRPVRLFLIPLEQSLLASKTDAQPEAAVTLGASPLSKTKAIAMNKTIRGLNFLAGGVLAVMLSSSGHVSAEPLPSGLSRPQWTAYADDAGTRLDYPENVFTVDDGPAPRGIGRVLRSSDGRALMIIYTEDNDERYSPASFVRANFRGAREELDYDRVTSRFFALSGDMDDLIFYNRCNFADGSRGPAHCVYLAYPRDEAQRWDRIVTRISLSLRPSR